MNASETATAALLAVIAFVGYLLVSLLWIFLAVLLWSLMGSFLGWAFSGHFAIWENKTGLTMAEMGAMLGFVSAAFRVSITQNWSSKA